MACWPPPAITPPDHKLNSPTWIALATAHQKRGERGADGELPEARLRVRILLEPPAFKLADGGGNVLAISVERLSVVASSTPVREGIHSVRCQDGNVGVWWK